LDKKQFIVPAGNQTKISVIWPVAWPLY